MSKLCSLNLRLIGLNLWIFYYWPIFWTGSFFSLQSLYNSFLPQLTWKWQAIKVGSPIEVFLKGTFYYIQWCAIQTALLPVYGVKWGRFERAKMTIKMLPASSYFKYLFKGFWSFDTVNMGSVGQRALKLLAVKVGGLKKKSAIWPQPL